MRRERPRFSTRIFGVFSRDIDLDETESLMMNLSLGGAFIKTENPAPPGTPITLRVYLGAEETPLSVSAEVVWLRRSDKGEEPGMGVKFTQVGSGDLDRIKKFLEGLIEADLFS